MTVSPPYFGKQGCVEKDRKEHVNIFVSKKRKKCVWWEGTEELHLSISCFRDNS